jgi:recombination protein RecA
MTQQEAKNRSLEVQPVSAETTTLNKKKMLEVTFAQIEKQHGKGLVMFLGDMKQDAIPAISSGSILIDDAIGVGGYPTGRVIEIYGPEASGKTTLALHAIAQAQQRGGICAYIDAEHALDTTYAGKLGVNINELIISQPDYGEQALDIAEMLVRSGSVDIVVIDSVAALVPKAELDGDMGDVHVGLQARLMSQALRKLTPIVHRSRTVFIFINQIRHNINSMPFASKETTTGGNALKFYASLRLDVRKVASLKKDDNHFGNRVAVKVVKNKMAPPFKRVELDILFGEGISHELDLLDAAIHYQVISQTGSWFALGQKKFAQGREQSLAYLKENPDFAKQVRELIMQAQAAAKAV